MFSLIGPDAHKMPRSGCIRGPASHIVKSIEFDFQPNNVGIDVFIFCQELSCVVKFSFVFSIERNFLVKNDIIMGTTIEFRIDIDQAQLQGVPQVTKHLY